MAGQTVTQLVPDSQVPVTQDEQLYEVVQVEHGVTQAWQKLLASLYLPVGQVWTQVLVSVS